MGTQTRLLPFGTANWDPHKDLKLEIKIYIDTDNGIGAIGTDGILAVDYEETASITLGGKKVDLKPTKSAGNLEMAFDIFDAKGDLVHHSLVPFNGEAKLSAKLDSQQTGIYKVDIKAKQL